MRTGLTGPFLSVNAYDLGLMMGHIKELLREASSISEVITDIGDHYAHRKLRDMARDSGIPIRNITRIALSEASPTTGVDTIATQLAPGLARWMVRHNVNYVINQGNLTTAFRHRIAGRATVLAAIQAANIRQVPISVIVGHGKDTVAGPWTFYEPFGDMDGTKTEDTLADTYSHIRVNPGLISGSSVEHYFGMSSDE